MWRWQMDDFEFVFMERKIEKNWKKLKKKTKKKNSHLNFYPPNRIIFSQELYNNLIIQLSTPFTPHTA